MKNLWLNGAAAAVVAAAVAGCAVPYNSCVPMTFDERVDQDNAAFVKQAIETYKARQGFKCNLELKPAESVGVFLSRHSHNRISTARKRDLLLLLENTLAGRISGLRDFNLVGRSGAVGGTSLTVTSSTQPSANYRMTYAITKLELNRLQDYRTIYDMNGKPRSQLYYYYRGVAKVEVSLYDPAGNQIFTFNEEFTTGDKDNGDDSILSEAVKNAANMAIERYCIATAPPLYVIQTTGGGTYVQISGGSAYGIHPGSRIKFYRNIVRPAPTLPGEPPKSVVHQQPVGYGIAGVNGAPIGSDDAWVYIDSGRFLFPADFRKPDAQPQRTVFVWTSAKPE